MRAVLRDFSEWKLDDLVESRPDVSAPRNGTALLLGNDPEACQVSSEVLERCGFAIQRLSRVAELRECCWESKARLLLCEDVIEDGDFRHVLQCTSKQELPIIVFSRLADWDEYVAAVRLGAYDLLRFPFRTGELRWVIGRALADSGSDPHRCGKRARGTRRSGSE